MRSVRVNVRGHCFRESRNDDGGVELELLCSTWMRGEQGLQRFDVFGGRVFIPRGRKVGRRAQANFKWSRKSADMGVRERCGLSNGGKKIYVCERFDI